MNLELRAAVPDAVVAAIAAFVRGQHTLHDVVVAGLSSKPAREVRNVVIQDEYTHDVVVRWEDGVFLVYDTT